MNNALIKVLDSSYERGFQQRQEALLLLDEQVPTSTLETLISNAADKADTAASPSLPDREPDR